jgi:hypothetical protein
VTEGPRLALRALDERYLPEAARRLRAWRARADVVGGRVSGAGRRGFVALRTRPQLSGALLAVAVLAGALAVVVSNHDSGARQQPTATTPNGGYSYSTIGPLPGQQVADYLRQARQRLAQVAAARPDASSLAIVDLSGYRRAHDVVQLFRGMQVSQVHYRVRVAGLDTRPHVAAVSGADQIPGVVQRSGQVEASTAVSLERYASTLPTTTPALKQQHDLLVKQAVIARAEAARLNGSCACIFAVVVQAPAKRLQALAALRAVRVVDPAPAGSAPGSVGFMPLPPDVTTTMPKTGILK